MLTGWHTLGIDTLQTQRDLTSQPNNQKGLKKDKKILSSDQQRQPRDLTNKSTP